MQPVKANYFQTYVSQYVPQPFELMQRAVDNAQKHYDAVAKNIEDQQAFLGKLNTHSGVPTEVFREYQSKYQNELDQIMNSGDLRHKENQVRKLARQLGEDYQFGRLGQYVKAGQTEAAYNKWMSDARGKKIGEGGVSSERSAYASDIWRRQTEQDIGDQGEVLTRVMRNSPDLNNLVETYGKQIKDSELDSTTGFHDYAGVPAGRFEEYYRMLTQNYKGVTDARAKAVIMGMLENDSDAMQEVQIRAAVNNASKYGESPSTYTPNQEEIAREMAKVVSPGVQAYSRVEGSRSAKYLTDTGEAAGRSNLDQTWGPTFAEKSNTIIENPTGKDVESFKSFLHGSKTQKPGADVLISSSFRNVLRQATNDEEGSESSLIATHYPGKKISEARSLIKGDLKTGNGPFAGYTSSTRQGMLRNINEAENLKKLAQEREAEALKRRDSVETKWRKTHGWDDPKKIYKKYEEQWQPTGRKNINGEDIESAPFFNEALKAGPGTADEFFAGSDVPKSFEAETGISRRELSGIIAAESISGKDYDDRVKVEMGTWNVADPYGATTSPKKEATYKVEVKDKNGAWHTAYFGPQDAVVYGIQMNDEFTQVTRSDRGMRQEGKQAYDNYINKTGNTVYTQFFGNTNLPDITIQKGDKVKAIDPDTYLNDPKTGLKKFFTNENISAFDGKTLYDDAGKPIIPNEVDSDYQSGENLKAIKKQLGLKDGDKLPEPSDFQVGRDPINGFMYVRTTFTNRKDGTTVPVKINIDDFVTDLDGVKALPNWKAAIAVKSVVEQPGGQISKIYDQWGEEVPGITYLRGSHESGDSNHWEVEGSDGNVRLTDEQLTNYLVNTRVF